MSIAFSPTDLPGARGARDEQVRHRGEVGDVRLTMDRLAERDGQLRASSARYASDCEELPKRDRLAVGIRNLDADRRLAGNAIDQHRLGLHREAQVVGQARDLAVHFTPASGLNSKVVTTGPG